MGWAMYLFFFSFPSFAYSLALGCFSRLDAPPYPCFSWPLREPRAFLASKEMPKRCRMASFAIDFKHANHASTMCAKACTLVLILFLLSLPRLGLSLSLAQLHASSLNGQTVQCRYRRIRYPQLRAMDTRRPLYQRTGTEPSNAASET